VELELEGDQLIQRVRVRRVVPQQVDEELVLVQLTLERVEDHVEDAVRVEVEVANDRFDNLEQKIISMN
jgi:hypothetical protein